MLTVGPSQLRPVVTVNIWGSIKNGAFLSDASGGWVTFNLIGSPEVHRKVRWPAHSAMGGDAVAENAIVGSNIVKRAIALNVRRIFLTYRPAARYLSTTRGSSSR